MPRSLSTPLDQLPDPLPITPITRPFDAAITPPGSKSLTNRALLLAALAPGTSTLRRPLIAADDTEVMMTALSDLGVVVFQSGDELRVGGCRGRWEPDPGVHEVALNLSNAGTATRFLTAAALFSPIPVAIDGNARMRQRPIGELVDALRHLGVTATYGGREGCPPVRLAPPKALPRSPTLTLPTTRSSQVISALLLIAPWIPGGLTLRLEGEITSRSYVAMTIGLLERLGAAVQTTDDLRTIRVGPSPPHLLTSPPPQAPSPPHPLTSQSRRGDPSPPHSSGIPPFDYTSEPDASGATYFWAAAALIPGARCRVTGLDDRSLQGDARFPELLARMGAQVSIEAEAASGIACRGVPALAPITADLSDMPDAAMTLAVVACFAPGRSILRGLRTLRVKETDRIEALRTELGRIGVQVETGVLGDPGTIAITPPERGIGASNEAPRVEFDTYDDHRVAMSLALVGLRRPNAFIRNPVCVAKTYPTYWRDLAMLGS